MAVPFATGDCYVNKVMYFVQRELEEYQDRKLYKPDRAEQLKLSKSTTKKSLKMPPLPLSANQAYVDMYESLGDIFAHGGDVWYASPNHRDFSEVTRIAAKNSKLPSDEEELAALSAFMMAQFRNKASHSKCQMFGLTVTELYKFIDTSIIFLRLIKRDDCQAIDDLQALEKDLARDLSIWTAQNAQPMEEQFMQERFSSETITCSSCGLVIETTDLGDIAATESPSKRLHATVGESVLCIGCSFLIAPIAASKSTPSATNVVDDDAATEPPSKRLRESSPSPCIGCGVLIAPIAASKSTPSETDVVGDVSEIYA